MKKVINKEAVVEAHMTVLKKVDSLCVLHAELAQIPESCTNARNAVSYLAQKNFIELIELVMPELIKEVD